MIGSWQLNKKSLPIILQNERAECGHACIAMVSSYWGQALSLHDLRQSAATSLQGTTLFALSEILENLGFITQALRLSLTDLKQIKCPAILHWNLNHFVVLKAVKKEYLIIHDPAQGVLRCSWEQVSKSFTGIALEIEKGNPLTQIPKEKPLTVYQLMKSASGLGQFILFLLFLSLSIEGLLLLNPLFMQYITDDVIGLGTATNLSLIALACFILLIAQVSAELLRGKMIIYCTHRLGEQWSFAIMRHLFSLPLSFFEKRHKADIQSKCQSIEQIQQKVSTDFVNALLDGLMMLVNLTVMLFYSRWLTLCALFSLLLYLGFRWFSYEPLRRETEMSLQQQARTSSLFLESLQGMMPIKIFSKESIRLQSWRNSDVIWRQSQVKVAHTRLLNQVVNQLLFQGEHLSVMCIGAYLVLSHKLSLGMLMAFLSYRLLLVDKASSFIQHIFDYRLISVQLTRLSDVLFEAPEVLAQEPTTTTIKGEITLDQISFRYHINEKAIIQNVSLSVQAGEKVVLVGDSGCGKTTLLKLMMGLLPPSEGQIFIDGSPLTQAGLRTYRNAIAAVMQEDALFSGSILDNIVFFEPNIDLKWVQQVARDAAIHDVISALPMGYETLLGEMGTLLSGGQKQRILLARALYKRPKILFLDEATSHLDVETEKKLNQSLKKMNVTQIVIAHRLETIRMADRVIRLKEVNHLI